MKTLIWVYKNGKPMHLQGEISGKIWAIPEYNEDFKDVEPVLKKYLD